MIIQLSIFLYIYALFLFAWLIFSAIALYHVFKFGFKNFVSYFSVVIFLSGAIILLVFSYSFLSGLDWSAGIFSTEELRQNSSDWGLN